MLQTNQFLNFPSLNEFLATIFHRFCRHSVVNQKKTPTLKKGEGKTTSIKHYYLQ